MPSSPVLLSAHQYPDQYFHNSHYRQANRDSPSMHQLHTLTGPDATYSLPPTPTDESSLAGRKRSRGDDHGPDEDYPDASGQITPVTPASRGEPVYGPGMTLIYPNDASHHYNSDATTGTWAEDHQDAALRSRPILNTRKSMRLGASHSSPATPLEQPQLPACNENIIVEEATRALGISWTRLDINENNLIKKRAFTRWITRHYPFLRDVELWLENSALPGYLGKAFDTTQNAQGYYLWSHDLHQGILVTRQATDLVLKLSSLHMSLAQAAETIKADLEPVVEASAQNAAILHNDRFLDDCPRPEAGGMDVD